MGRVARLRLMLAGFGAAIGGFGLWCWDLSPGGPDVVCKLRSWLHGYDGCRCPDCLRTYLGMGWRSDVVAVPFLGYGRAGDIDDRLLVMGAGLLAASALGRRPIAWLMRLGITGLGACAGCGYPRPESGTKCPECGRPETA